MAIRDKAQAAIMRAANERLDGFVNLLTGQGDSAVDKGASWDIQSINPLSMPQLKQAYRGSYYARRIVDLLAEDAVVRGWKVMDPSDPDATQDLRWAQEDKKHNIPQILTKALKWARAYGTGYIVPITYDLQPLNKPLSLDLLYQVQDIMVFDPDECRPQNFYAEDTPTTRLGEPSAFRINAGSLSGFSGRWGQAFTGTVDIHPSRIIPLIGNPLSSFDRINHPYGLGESILQAMWLALARADGIDGAAAILASEMKQDIVRIPDLKAIGTSDARDAFQLRMKLLKLSKSLLGMIVLGAGEEYESRASNVAGFRDLSQTARDALVAASGYPEAILHGKATSGLATAPGTEQEAYHRKVETAQVQDLQPALNRIYQMIAAAKTGPFAGQKRYRKFMIEFNPLVRESEKDTAARSLIHAQRDSIHAGMISAVDPSLGAAFVRYLAANRYGKHGWQDQLPPFEPADWDAPADPEEAPEMEAAPLAPDGQKPSEKTPQGKATTAGAQGVDLQVLNTGKGQFDSMASGAQSLLTEWVQIDAETYEGETVRLPAFVKEAANKALFWKQKYPEIYDLLDEVEWRCIQQFASRGLVGQETLRQMDEAADYRGAYSAALHRARSHKEPWTEPNILRWMGWGGSAGISWAQEQRLLVG